MLSLCDSIHDFNKYSTAYFNVLVDERMPLHSHCANCHSIPCNFFFFFSFLLSPFHYSTNDKSNYDLFTNDEKSKLAEELFDRLLYQRFNRYIFFPSARQIAFFGIQSNSFQLNYSIKYLKEVRKRERKINFNTYIIRSAVNTHIY